MIQEAVDLFNEAAVRCGWPIVRRLTSDRERKLRGILRGGLEEWKEALGKAEASDFLCGRTERVEKHQGWRFSIDAMIRESFFVKLLEGNYDNRGSLPQTEYKSPEKLLWEARLRGKIWLTGQWGPKPGEPGCRVPADIAEAHQKRLH